MQGNDLYQEIISQLSALSAKQTETVRDYLRELSTSDDAPMETDKKYLTFSCCDQVFGIDIYQVIQITRILPITPLPDSSPYMKGVIAVRDEMMPVIDLRVRLGRAAELDKEKNCIVIVRAQEQSFGLIVDSICNVESIPPEEICPPPKQDDSKSRYLLGIVKRDAVILLVDVEHLLAERDFETMLDLPAIQTASSAL